MKQRHRARAIKRCLPGAMPWPAGGWAYLVPTDMATMLRGPAATTGPDDLELRTGVIGKIDAGFRLVSDDVKAVIEYEQRWRNAVIFGTSHPEAMKP